MLRLVIANILSHPNEEKFCRIKKENAKLQARLLSKYVRRSFINRPAGAKLLKACGFVEEDAYLVMKRGNLNIPWLTIINQRLESNLQGSLFTRAEYQPVHACSFSSHGSFGSFSSFGSFGSFSSFSSLAGSFSRKPPGCWRRCDARSGQRPVDVLQQHDR